MKAPDCRVNAPEVNPAPITNDAGAVSRLLITDTVMFAPPTSALFVNVTVHVLDELGPRLVGLQDTEETNTGATRLMVALAELLL